MSLIVGGGTCATCNEMTLDTMSRERLPKTIPCKVCKAPVTVNQFVARRPDAGPMNRQDRRMADAIRRHAAAKEKIS